MPSPDQCCAIIPARYASSRFPGKPLADILGKPMIWHVYTRVRACPELTSIHLATDDERILASAREHAIPAVMTSSDHDSGTDRIHEAAQKLGLSDQTVVVNVQGDEPALNPEMISQLLRPFSDEAVRVSTLMRRLRLEEVDQPHVVKVAVSNRGRAVYFSRSPIPYQSAADDPVYWGHIGLYAYRWQTLKAFHQLGPSPLERLEKLEQLRLVEAGIPIEVRPTEHASHGVDRPEDIALVEKIIREGAPHASNTRS
jgi:3-deoxy-manno-octulosonate cytidylyltransferase (CMP-KDO synthetase)